MRIGFLLLGILFGFLLSRAGATHYDYYAQLFLLENFQLLWIISSAVLVGIIGNQILKKVNATSVWTHEKLKFSTKPIKKGLVVGSSLFGIGWGLAGSCPGTAPAMLGEGKLLALFVIFGIAIGTYIYGFATVMRANQ